MITVKDIVRGYLIGEEYDGLYNPGLCSCPIGDLEACGNIQSHCRPGYTVPCNGVGCDDCEQPHISEIKFTVAYNALRVWEAEEQACMVEQLIAEEWGLA